MSSDLLQSLEIFTELVFELVGQDLRVLAVTMILLTIQEPIGDLVLTRILHNCNDPLNLPRSQINAWWALNGMVIVPYLLISQFPGSLVHVDVGFFAHQIGVATSHTL